MLPAISAPSPISKQNQVRTTGCLEQEQQPATRRPTAPSDDKGRAGLVEVEVEVERTRGATEAAVAGFVLPPRVAALVDDKSLN